MTAIRPISSVGGVANSLSQHHHIIIVLLYCPKSVSPWASQPAVEIIVSWLCLPVDRWLFLNRDVFRAESTLHLDLDATYPRALRWAAIIFQLFLRNVQMVIEWLNLCVCDLIPRDPHPGLNLFLSIRTNLNFILLQCCCRSIWVASLGLVNNRSRTGGGPFGYLVCVCVCALGRRQRESAPSCVPGDGRPCQVDEEEKRRKCGVDQHLKTHHWKCAPRKRSSRKRQLHLVQRERERKIVLVFRCCQLFVVEYT